MVDLWGYRSLPSGSISPVPSIGRGDTPCQRRFQRVPVHTETAKLEARRLLQLRGERWCASSLADVGSVEVRRTRALELDAGSPLEPVVRHHSGRDVRGVCIRRLERRLERRNYGQAGECTPTCRSQVSRYTNRSMMTTKTRPSLMICSKVKLTTNVSLNMVLSIQSGQALGAQTLTVRFAFAIGYVSWLSPTKHLADGSWGSYSHDASPAAGLQALAECAPPRDAAGDANSLVHERKNGWGCVMPNVRAKRAVTAGRQARAGENVPRTTGPGLVACR